MTYPFAFLERRFGGRRIVAVFSLLLAFLPRSVAAQAPPIELTWHAPPECPQQDVVLSRARALLGSKVPKVGYIRADGTIEKRVDGFELRLLVDEGGRGGERKVWARQCDELSGAAAISLVLLLVSGDSLTDGQALDATALKGHDAEVVKPPPPPPPKPRPPQPDSTKAARNWHLLAAAPQLAFGLRPLPKPTVGLAGGLGAQGRAWSIRLLGQWFSTQTLAAPVQPYGAYVRRASAGVWGCWDWHRARFSLSPCLSASAAHLRATGYGPFLLPQTQNETSFAVGVGTIARLQVLNSLALMLSIGGQLELNRPIILLGTVGTVRQLAPVSGLVQVGPEWIF